MSFYIPRGELGTISDRSHHIFEVNDVVRKYFGTVLAGTLAIWGRMTRKRTSYDTDKLCEVHCDSLATVRFYERRVM